VDVGSAAAVGELLASPPATAGAAIEKALRFDVGRTELVLVRHGQQDRSLAAGRPGQTDPPLTSIGRRQAALVGQALGAEAIARIYCSDLTRALETATIVTAGTRSDNGPTVVPDLREVRLFRELPQDRPLLELLGQDAVERAAQQFLVTRRFDAFPFGEPSQELRTRALRALTAIARAHEGEQVAVVAHGGLINAFLAAVLGMQQDMFFMPAHASVTRVLYADGRWALSTANETAHLAGEQLVTF